jgi:hypothetical protein
MLTMMHARRALACAEMIDDERRRAVEVARAREALAAAAERQRELVEARRVEAASRAMVATLAATWSGGDLCAPVAVEFEWSPRQPLAQAVLAGALGLAGPLIIGAGVAAAEFELTALGRLLVRRWRSQAGHVG